MKSSFISAINKFDLFRVASNGSDITVYWLMATNEENSHTLNYRMHRHTFFEIHFVLRGNIVYGFNDHEMDVRANSFTVIPPDTYHKVLSHSDEFCKITLACDLRSDIKDSVASLRRSIYPVDDSILNVLKAVNEYSVALNTYTEEIVKTRLTELIYLIAAKNTQPRLKGENTDYRVFKAKKYIEDNPDILLTVSEVAAYCNLSSKQLGRLFERYEDKSVLDYIHDVKLSIATALVRDTSEPFEAIAHKLGFSDESYFYKFFYRKTGMTPGEMRKLSANK